MPHPWTKPELMRPAGYWPQLKAAIEAGADAVYCGLTHLSARAKGGFGLAELPEVMQTLHARGVKGFITFNTLIFDAELHAAERAIAAIAEAGADAIIVQDVGMAQLARRIAPALEVHGSTHSLPEICMRCIRRRPTRQYRCTCSCARLSNSRRRWLCVRRVSPLTTSNCTASNRPWNV